MYSFFLLRWLMHGNEWTDEEKKRACKKICKNRISQGDRRIVNSCSNYDATKHDCDWIKIRAMNERVNEAKKKQIHSSFFFFVFGRTYCVSVMSFTRKTLFKSELENKRKLAM